MLLSSSRTLLLGAAIVAAGATMAQASSMPRLAPPEQLSCEQQSNPLAVDAAHPQFGWMLRAKDENARGVRQSAWRIVASSSMEKLSRNEGDLWDSGRVASNRALDVGYGGKTLAAEERVFWKVEVWDGRGAASGWSAPAQFTMAPAQLKAQWIAAAPADSAAGRAEGVSAPMPVFRRQFDVRKPIARALLYVSGMGQDEVQIDGARVGNRELTPGWTDYRKRILYDTYDVSPMLHKGENAIGVLLGNGMFNVAKTAGRYTKFVGSFGEPQCLLELHLLFRDGSSEVIATGPDWQTAPGPITFSSTYGGEDYDARALPATWDIPGRGEAGAWRSVDIVPGPGGTLHPEVTAPIRVMHIYRPISRKTLPSGAQVFDLGQNFAGWPAITVEGEAGAQIKLISGELLAPDGTVSQRSEGGTPKRGLQWYSYTLGGRGVERWHPRFSYYGFRYVQVEITGKARVLSLEGEAVHSSAPETGTFDSSITLLNRIQVLILHAIKNNMVSVLTDCPHREKLGWLEQTHLMGSALNYDFDLERLYNKIENDMAEAQKPNGLVPTIAPQYTVFGKPWNVFDDSPEWGSAAVLDPWIAYQRYGDLENLRSHYATMRGYTDYLTSRSVNGIVDYGLGDWYDIGPKPPGFAQLTSRALTATAVYYQDIVALQATARLLGDTAEEQKMAALGDSVAKAFQQRFYHPDQHFYDRDSQTANAMPLVLGLAPTADRGAVLQHLVADIRAHNNHVTAGDVGFHYVVDALQDNGASNVLLDMLLRRDAPSYGYQLSQGATSLTEAWDANPHSSQDHLMLGHAEEWFYAGLGGIRVDFAKDATDPITIDPAMLPRIASADVSYRSVRGTIRVAWKYEQGRAILDVKIPPNTTAMVMLPVSAAGQVREGNGSAAKAEGVSFVRRNGTSSEYSVLSGHYRFSFPAPRASSASATG